MRNKYQTGTQAARRRTLLRRRAAAVFVGVTIPLTAYSLSLTDYLNVAGVAPSSNQFEQNSANNTGQVQVTPNAELTIIKIIENDDGGTATISDFSVITDGGTLTFDAGSTAGTATTYTSNKLFLAPGTYSLEESDVYGYGEGSWSCTVGIVNDASYNAGEVSLAFGEQAVCTIINDDVAPTLTLTKTLINDNGGNLTIADFDLTIDDGTTSKVVTSGVAETVASNVDIVISESDLAAYAEGTWSCTDANALDTGWVSVTGGTATGTTVNLLAGSAVTCEITNNDKGVDLSIVKSVDDDTPDIGQEITFTMAISNAGPDEATGVTVTDIVPTGFTYAGTISGGDASDDTDPTGSGLSWTINSIPASGAAVLLTFTATVNAP